MNEIIISFVAISIGYLLGSVSPAYFLGWALKKIDIRTIGTKNAGTTNVYKSLGIIPAIITASYDLIKGLLAIYLAYLLGAKEAAIYLAGIFAIIGHIYPFYLKFRGGQGMATALGLLVYLTVKVALGKHYLDIYHLPESIILMVIYAFIIFYIVKRGEILAIFGLPVFIALLFLNYKINTPLISLALVLATIFIVQLYNTVNQKLISFEGVIDQLLHWRTLARPLAALFPILYLLMARNHFFYLIGGLAAIFIILDLIRLPFVRVNLFLFQKTKFLFKQKEEKRFSSMTFFLSAIFLVFLIFPQNVAISASLFVIFGDLAAKYFGLIYPQKRFLAKGFEGSLAYFVFSLLPAFIFSFFVPIPFWILTLGALTAAITEAVSIFGIDDNFTVAIISGAVMFAFLRLV